MPKNEHCIFYKPVQDRTVAIWWLDESIKKANSSQYPNGGTALAIFMEKMIREKYRIQEWQISYIGEKFKYKPSWASIQFSTILKQYK